VVDVNNKKCQTFPFTVDSAMVNPASLNSVSHGHLLAFKSMQLDLMLVEF